MNRKKFLKYLGISGGVLTFSPTLLACNSEAQQGLVLPNSAFSQSLQFPEEIRVNDFELVAESTRKILAGNASSDIYTMNGTLPSPTIRIKRGESLNIVFQNRIDRESIIHWHGLIVPPDMDGHPKDAVEPGQNYKYHFNVNQRAGTYWYHPHPDQLTGPQVYRGLGGFFIVEDDEEQALNLPSGERELPLIVQDKQFNNSGQLTYNLGMMDRMMGFFGNTLLVNGQRAPYHKLSTSWHRLRLLNGSNARILDFSFSDNSSFYVIGSDGGLLGQPHQISSIRLTPGERADLLVDFSAYDIGDNVFIVAKAHNSGSSMMSMMRNRGNRRGMRGMMNGGNDTSGNQVKILEFRITKDEQDNFQLPQKLSEISFPTSSEADSSRRINLTMEMMQGPAIDGKFFEMTRVDQKVRQGALEVWEFTNNTMMPMPHPMHIHATQFKVLNRTGGDLAPHERGWKDTVLVGAGETVRVLTKFDAPKGMYVFHCHNLEHEDNGMMANLEIV
jgi:FtsP/CotA-like multicopper oxidase with cupredoxin domain